MSGVLSPVMSQCIHIVLNTASSFSHLEGSMVTRVAVQSRGPRNTHREVTYLQQQPRHMHACGCVLAYANKRLTILITYTHPDQKG